MPKIVLALDETTQVPVKPKHINTKEHFYDAFGNRETEVSAHYVVLLCQQKGEWLPFTIKEIEELYKSKSHYDGFEFNRLISDGWIVKRDGKYYVTQGFVARVWESSPAL